SLPLAPATTRLIVSSTLPASSATASTSLAGQPLHTTPLLVASDTSRSAPPFSGIAATAAVAALILLAAAIIILLLHRRRKRKVEPAPIESPPQRCTPLFGAPAEPPRVAGLFAGIGPRKATGRTSLVGPSAGSLKRDEIVAEKTVYGVASAAPAAPAAASAAASGSDAWAERAARTAVAAMSAAEVRESMLAMGVGPGLVSALEENDIDGASLLALTDEELRAMGIGEWYSRHLLLRTAEFMVEREMRRIQRVSATPSKSGEFLPRYSWQGVRGGGSA
ncbi:hypothetical protein HDU96_001774, partial [Phlyctochytrium bullatum]